MYVCYKSLIAQHRLPQDSFETPLQSKGELTAHVNDVLVHYLLYVCTFMHLCLEFVHMSQGSQYS